MRLALKILIPIILIIVFIASCGGAARILAILTEERGFIDINESNINSPNVIYDADVLVFTPPENVEAAQYMFLESYLIDKKEYSFLMPEGKFEYYNAKLIENVRQQNRENTPRIKVTPISNDRQAIELTIVGDRRTYITRYEATDKNIYLKPVKTDDLGTFLPILLISLVVGVAGVFLTRYLLKRSILSKLEMRLNARRKINL